eukprot:258622-Karenia_brevis.AAC.1
MRLGLFGRSWKTVSRGARGTLKLSGVRCEVLDITSIGKMYRARWPRLVEKQSHCIHCNKPLDVITV